MVTRINRRVAPSKSRGLRKWPPKRYGQQQRGNGGLGKIAFVLTSCCVLPPISIVLNRQPTVWESYKWYIIGGIVLCLAETLLILGLLWQRARRRNIEAHLAIVYDRLRSAMESGKAVGWEWDLKIGRGSWFGDLKTMFGISSESFAGRPEDFYPYVHPEDRHQVSDVTDRRAAEEALRQSEDNLRLLLDSTAEAIYGIDLEGRCTFCNPACLRALGYQHVDDLLGRNMHDLIHHSRAHGAMFHAKECRIMRALQTGQGVHVDDEVLWDAKGTSFPAEYWSYPQRKGQEVVGAVVTFLDITERKRTEVALANLTRRLIEAQELERTRIARELHDDIGQRLALLTIELGQFDSSDLPAEVASRIGELQKQSSEIATDVQSLSHELHSSKLEYLGIVTAMRGFCKEFSAQQNVEIVFAHDAISGMVPSDVSLCLFRILQEALHNAVKYSGVRHFDAQLRASSEAIDLTVRDSGPGFDVEEAMKTSGLGLVSMAERIKLLGGQLSIESHPGSGTTIHARVPLREAARAAP